MNNESQMGIAVISQIPIRETPSNRAQMVNQLIFGETYDVIEFFDKEWVQIRCHYDNYEGYIAANQFYKLNIAYNNSLIVKSKIACCSFNNGTSLLSMGSNLPNFNEGNFKINDVSGTFESADKLNPSESTANLLENRTNSWLNVPYLWGGRSVFGVDCSGFTQVIYKTLNVFLPRDAYQQAELGENVYFIEGSQCGDLAFFDNEEERITHVGIILPNRKIIHASGKVKVDTLDHRGIFCSETKKYTHQLRIIKRILPPDKQCFIY